MVIVLGIVGRIGSGKDVATKYLIENYGFKEVHMGNLVREELRSAGLEESRENLQKFAKEKTDKFGMDYWAKKVVSKIKECLATNSRFVINGIRRSFEVEVPKKEFGRSFKLLLIEADPKIRLERLKVRGRPGDPKNFKAFLEQERNELKLYDFEKIEKEADFIIKNEADLEAFYQSLDKLINTLIT